MNSNAVKQELSKSVFMGKFRMDSKYKIQKMDCDIIAHGQISDQDDWRDASFILCKDEKEQDIIYHNLINIRLPMVVRTLGLVSMRFMGSKIHWIIIERVSSTLQFFIYEYKRRQKIWSQGCLDPTFQQIVSRDMISGMTSCHGNNYIHGLRFGNKLASSEFLVVEGKVKFAFFTRAIHDRTSSELKKLKGKDNSDLMKLFKEILEDPEKSQETCHFLEQEISGKLRMHPILLSDYKRFQFPAKAFFQLRKLYSFLDIDMWYPRIGSAVEQQDWGVIVRGAKDADDYIKLLDYKKKVAQSTDKEDPKKKDYDFNSPASRLNFFRNVSLHLTHKEPRKVVFDLNNMFPNYLCEIYELTSSNMLAECC